jgi:hypothetical protein
VSALPPAVDYQQQYLSTATGTCSTTVAGKFRQKRSRGRAFLSRWT